MVNKIMAAVLILCSAVALTQGILYFAPQMFFLAGSSALAAVVLLSEINGNERKGK